MDRCPTKKMKGNMGAGYHPCANEKKVLYLPRKCCASSIPRCKAWNMVTRFESSPAPTIQTTLSMDNLRDHTWYFIRAKVSKLQPKSGCCLCLYIAIKALSYNCFYVCNSWKKMQKNILWYFKIIWNLNSKIHKWVFAEIAHAHYLHIQ